MCASATAAAIIVGELRFAGELLQDVLLINVFLRQVFLTFKAKVRVLVLGLGEQLAGIQELFLASRQLRTPYSHNFVQFAVRYYFQVSVAFAVRFAYLNLRIELVCLTIFHLLEHAILYGHLILEELDLLVFFSHFLLVHLDDILLCVAQYFLL